MNKQTANMKTTTTTTTNKNKENVLYYLYTLFGAVFDADIIKCVARNFEYDVQKSSNYLLEMTSSNDKTNEASSSSSSSSMANIVKKKNEKIRKSPQRNNNHKKKMTTTVDQNNSSSILYPSMSSNSIATSTKTTTTTNNKSKRSQRIDDVINEICKGHKVLIILRGLPGSGKSYLAKTIIQRLFGNLKDYNQHVFSTDNFFLNNNNVYIFNPNRLSEAHEWNQKRAFNAMKSGYSPIIIDNTNTQMWEMKAYAMMAIDFGYIIEILEPDTSWLFNIKELIRKNQHNLPKEKIHDMLDRYDKCVTTEKLLSAYKLSYHHHHHQRILPQFRSQPPLSYKFNNNNNNINLMVFDDKVNTSQQSALKNSNNKTDEQQQQQHRNPVDKVLMCKSEQDSPAPPPTTITILKPNQINRTTRITNNEHLFEDIENAWGIDEKALQSWNIVTPIMIENIQQDEKQAITNNDNDDDDDDDDRILKITMENSTMTDFCDFEYLENYKKQKLPDGYRLVDAKSCDFYGGEIILQENHQYETPKKVLMFDKSCQKDDDDGDDDHIIDDRDDDIKLQHLKELFTSIPRSYLKELLDKCNKNFNWVVELLLADSGTNQLKNEENDDDSNEIGNTTQCKSEIAESIFNDNDDDDDNNNNNAELNESLKNFRQKQSISKQSKELKKLIESKIDINKEHYSEHVFRLKQIKFGNCLPSTSSTQQQQPDDNDDSDSDTDTDSSSLYETNPKEMVELNLGDMLVQQLQLKFGGNDLSLPQGFQPIVQVPIELARQLYMLHMESVCQQMETQNSILESLVKEDEEFAKKLQQQENDQFLTINNTVQQQQHSSINFTEIIEQQATASSSSSSSSSHYRRENEQWKHSTSSSSTVVDTLAAKLTKQKLFETFPNIDNNILLEVLHAYNNDFYKTVEVVCASFGIVDDDVVKEIMKQPPLSQTAIQEMKDDESKCQDFMNNIDQHQQHDEGGGGDDDDDENENYPATFYREKADKHLQNRLQLYQKAQNYYQKGMTEVAMFYSELARKETNYYDRANHLAASTFLNQHSKRLQKFDTLDLHFLYVKEAISALDLFIDQNINLLQNSGSGKSVQNLFVITGRGKRSGHGIAKIKPAVISRLKKRKIRYVELNPGLLKIKVGKYSSTTSDLLLLHLQ